MDVDGCDIEKVKREPCLEFERPPPLGSTFKSPTSIIWTETCEDFHERIDHEEKCSFSLAS